MTTRAVPRSGMPGSIGAIDTENEQGYAPPKVLSFPLRIAIPSSPWAGRQRAPASARIQDRDVQINLVWRSKRRLLVSVQRLERPLRGVLVVLDEKPGKGCVVELARGRTCERGETTLDGIAMHPRREGLGVALRVVLPPRTTTRGHEGGRSMSVRASQSR